MLFRSNRDSDDERNSMVSQEMMDTDQCIQRLIRSELEGSDHRSEERRVGKECGGNCTKYTGASPVMPVTGEM